MKFSNKSIHTSKPQKNMLDLEQSPCPKSLLSAHVAQSFKSICNLSLQLTPSITLTCPSMPEGASPALAWLLGGSPVSLWSQWQINQADFCWGFTTWTTSGLAKRIPQEHITRSREAVSKSLFFLQGAGCQMSCVKASPSLSNSFSETTCEANQSPERYCPINVIHIFHSTHTPTPCLLIAQVRRCQGM